MSGIKRLSDRELCFMYLRQIDEFGGAAIEVEEEMDERGITAYTDIYFQDAEGNEIKPKVSEEFLSRLFLQALGLQGKKED